MPLPVKFFGPRDIKWHVKRYLESIDHQLKDKVAVDLPAGEGYTSKILYQLGAKVRAYDLFPESFGFRDLPCEFADLSDSLPLDTGSVDFLICQEGIEHLPDQFFAFKEFNRVLKDQGRLIITTPNYSNLRSKLSYLLSESERYVSYMPPNEVDSIWASDIGDTASGSKKLRFYWGHIFLIGIQKLRMLANISGFRIKKIHPVKITNSSLVLFFIFYPLILSVSFLSYLKIFFKTKNDSLARKVYTEQIKLNLHPTVLLGSHLFIEFEKLESLEKSLERINLQNL
ncbi:MAG: methyltransferase domain-containing protein [Deltaproteobacteria bacterium]|nr:methyltransferase domain-containing protein [Deltaproteobacteria bacterium]